MGAGSFRSSPTYCRRFNQMGRGTVKSFLDHQPSNNGGRASVFFARPSSCLMWPLPSSLTIVEKCSEVSPLSIAFKRGSLSTPQTFGCDQSSSIDCAAMPRETTTGHCRRALPLASTLPSLGILFSGRQLKTSCGGTRTFTAPQFVPHQGYVRLGDH